MIISEFRIEIAIETNRKLSQFFFIQQNFGIFTHPGPYEEQDYHSLSQDAQNQGQYLENSPEFYAGMLDQKYNQHYHKNTFNSRGKQINFAHWLYQSLTKESLC